MLSASPSSGKGSLIAAAEQLVAERGLYGVRASEVVKAAGHKNNSAVTYHFGSWQKLLEAVWQRHAEPINAERATMIARAVDRGTYDLPAMVEAYVRPLVAEVGRNKPSYWARFNEQWVATIAMDIFNLDEATVARQPSTESTTVLHNLFLDIVEVLTHLDYSDRTRRVAMMGRFVVTTLAAWEREGETALPLEKVERELISVALALLQAP